MAMNRLDATRIAAELAGQNPIIGGVGNATFDLSASDRPNNFYMWNSMGMEASIGLGLALARSDLRVVVLAGDGSLLMNLSALPTATMNGASNLVIGRPITQAPDPAAAVRLIAAELAAAQN